MLKHRPAQARRELLLEALPRHNWSFGSAGIAVGYSKSYAETRLAQVLSKDVEFCRRLEAKKREIKAATRDDRELCRQKLLAMVEDSTTPKTTRIRAMELLGKMGGWFSETRIVDMGPRARELTETRRLEAQRIARTLIPSFTPPPDVQENH
jgi:hypothetical protein